MRSARIVQIQRGIDRGDEVSDAVGLISLIKIKEVRCKGCDVLDL